MRALEKLERYEEAVEVLDRVLSRKPEHIRGAILCRKSEILFKMGDMEPVPDLRQESCDAGFKPCCDRQQASDD